VKTALTALLALKTVSRRYHSVVLYADFKYTVYVTADGSRRRGNPAIPPSSSSHMQWPIQPHFSLKRVGHKPDAACERQGRSDGGYIGIYTPPPQKKISLP